MADFKGLPKIPEGYATGGYTYGNGNITGGIMHPIAGGSYIIQDRDNIKQTMQRIQSQVQHTYDIANRTEKLMFATICIAVGLDTQELRDKFRTYYIQVSQFWEDEHVYNYLIEKAYEVKYGEPTP